MSQNNIDISSKIVELNNKLGKGNFSKGANKGNAPDPQQVQNVIKNISKKEGK